MDECDRASAIASKFQKDALARQIGRGRPLRVSRDICIDCGEDIPDARRKAVQGCQRCVSCESEFERNRR